MMEKYKHLKETLLCAVEGQMCDLPNANTKELGEAIDMIKDLEEAIYYSAITKAMKADEEEISRHHNKEENEYTYYDDKKGYVEYNMGSGKRYADWSDNTTTNSRDMREGRSGMTRRTYMEGKEMHKDKQNQMRELEKYMQELTTDMVEMIEHASPEEKQYLEKKLAALSQKIGQIND